MMKRIKLSFLLPLLCLLALPIAVPAGDGMDDKILHQEKSLYRNIFVYERDDAICLGFSLRSMSIDAQSCIYPNDQDKMYYDYSKLMMGALYLNPAPSRILVAGLGGGVIPKALWKTLPYAQIDIVEIDPAVHRAAKEYFGFPEDRRLTVHEMDARVFVKRALKKGSQYDLIVLDAFNGDYIPEHLLTQEFLEEVKPLLSEKGVLAANTFSQSKLYQSESVTYEKVFGEFYNVKMDNRIIFWRRSGLPTLKEMADAAAAFDEQFEAFGFNKGMIISRMSTKKDWNEDAPVLTDQYAPSNLLKSM